jgi:hypothetical protein
VAGGSASCQVSKLYFALGANTAGSGDRTQVVDLTNKGSAACTMDGFAGVDLIGIATGDGTEIDVTPLVITPPNTSSSAQLTWSAGILLQDAATHPGTHITPIAAGG